MQRKHINHDTVREYIELGLFPLLEGPAGSGKTTTAKAVAEELELKFYSMSMTKQTSLSHIIGFKSVTGDYISTQFREALEFGGMMLLDELDAADPNTLLCLNTIENGYMSFPDKIIDVHPDFVIVATANPSNQGSIYTGRSKLDFATKDRFMPVDMPLDHALEQMLTDSISSKVADKARELLVSVGVTRMVTMRDTIRFHTIKHKIIHINPLNVFVRENVEVAEKLQDFYDKIKLSLQELSDANSLDELYGIVQARK